ncbi:hypothetical protein [Bacillus kexueae]|uniref:hypothetical protein n=1 Tax=Aeribacillus kexueae TaxID=2078952 RepID=UPI001FAEA255|nr:hypothetical protein [Bacillus kexueae]
MIQMSAFNWGDIIFQTFMFISLLVIPIGIVLFIFASRKRNKKIQQLEEKIDQLIKEKDERKGEGIR